MIGIIRASLSRPICIQNQQYFANKLWKSNLKLSWKNLENTNRKWDLMFSCKFHSRPSALKQVLICKPYYKTGNVLRFFYSTVRFETKSSKFMVKINRNQFRTIFTSSRFLQRDQQNNISFFNNDTALYISAILIFMIGIAYAAVPLYRLFCQATGIGGDPRLANKFDLVKTMNPIRERKINVFFNADHHAAMRWNFKPTQKEITVVPGETALAFYTAKNPTDEPIVGVATYNVLPFQAGLYFNKIQCFCFEEQWLNPHEEVDMPVFFYIDPDYDDDPVLADVDDIVLSYTFFKAEKGKPLPLPGFMRSKSIPDSNKQPVVA
nr:cytochrome c oxidase assembly protein COX11, mitochondrial-like [Ciona intestinalis]|eukprot:XP_002127969.1 cytochrome c oxidase assembly protein COX11, mitochondrial-like [Ciona intestinalis]